MSIEMFLKDGGFVTMEGVEQGGDRHIKMSYVDYVAKTGLMTDLVTIHSKSIKEGLEYMPEAIERMAMNPNYKGIELDVRGVSGSKDEVPGGVFFANLLAFGCDAVFEFDRDANNIKVNLYDDKIPSDVRESLYDFDCNMSVNADTILGGVSRVADSYILEEPAL